MKKTILFAFLCARIYSAQAQVTLQSTHENSISAAVGSFQTINYREGGFSGLHYIPGTNGTEFWTLSDRGVNIDAANANPSACRPTYDKLYPFPNYAPKIHKIKIVGGEITVLETISIKRPNGTGATGLINPTGFGSTATEVATTNVVTDCAQFNNNTAPKDIWGIDSEGIDIDMDGNFWICEEGGPTIWKVNSNGVVLKRYTPYSQTPQSEDVIIDNCFSFRRNNRGFEGITVTPNGKIYAMIQSPIYYKNVSGVAAGGSLSNSRIHRILEIDPVTNTTRMFAYVNDGAIGGSSDIRPSDQKIGDLKAINNTTFLVIEQAARGAQNVKKMYTIDISTATPVLNGLSYSSNTKTLEELENPVNLAANGITPVNKTLLFDLQATGWPTALDKAEGIAIIDANTIAICNDNDYGQTSAAQDGIATETNTKSTLFIYKLNGVYALQNYIPNTNVLANVDFIAINKVAEVYPNPFTNTITIENTVAFENYSILDMLGSTIKVGKTNESSTLVYLEDLSSGIYILKLNSQTIKIVKK